MRVSVMPEACLPILLLMGPTCSGKTALAIEAVQSLPIEIINVDSALVYQGLNIGAARPLKRNWHWRRTVCWAFVI